LDDGPGLSADEANAVFGKFYRGENASAGGAGLGLAIVKGFSDAMGARVTAANRADRRGAVFTIAFPAAASITESP
jgi:two-component system sensor histidine kinase KdpD